MTYWILGVGALVAVGVSVLIVLGSQGGGPSSSAGSLQGLQETNAPWQPEYKFLAERLAATKIPPPGSEKYHIHSRLSVFIDGKQTPVPKDIGISPRQASALHTHDVDGIMHIEADAPRDVKLSEFFVVWGVKFSKGQIGGYKNENGKTVQVFVNGQKVDDPENHLIKPRDDVVVGYGAEGSFPAKPATELPKDL